MDIAKKIKNPAGKSIFILGGSKTATKVPMLEKMIEKFDMVIIGGSVANDIYKEAGYEIGLSKIDSNFIFDKKLFEKIIKSKKVFMPKMVITKNGTKKITELSKEDNILDISPQSFESIEKKLKEADFVFFNGPMGYYEDGYDRGTKYLLKILANKNNFFVAGGGNTSSAIFEMGLESNVDFISTGGGALMKIISK
jgi:phosphoglycerate kinase